MRPPIDLPPMKSFEALHVAMLDGADDGAAKRVFEHRRAIGRAALLVHVGKVERHDRDAACGQGARITGHERMKMTGAGAVREHEQRVERAVALGRIERGRDGRVGIAGELERDGTHKSILITLAKGRAWIHRTIATETHGRYLVDIPEHSRATLVGFHGYQENAAITLDVLRQIAAGRSIGIVSVQGLHRFYTRANDVVASWMTKEDRELAIADNVAYVAKVLSAVADEYGITRPLIYAGFSQGVAMAYRAAALAQRPCDGVIALAGDVPPDVAPLAASLPPVLIGRGTEDKWYTAEQGGQGSARPGAGRSHRDRARL